jgi:hypothetical protein
MYIKTSGHPESSGGFVIPTETSQDNRRGSPKTISVLEHSTSSQNG